MVFFFFFVFFFFSVAVPAMMNYGAIDKAVIDKAVTVTTMIEMGR